MPTLNNLKEQTDLKNSAAYIRLNIIQFLTGSSYLTDLAILLQLTTTAQEG